MPRIIPEDWMPAARMSRIHLHWTAGRHTANSAEKKAYHLLVEGDGTLVRGVHAISANERPVKSKYAPHTFNANTKAIGVSLCCMVGAIERPFASGDDPMTETQWRNGILALADLAERYGILVTPETILTHAEVAANLGIKQKNKWDITRLSFDSSLQGAREIGDELRARVAAALGQDDDTEADREIPEDLKPPRYRVSGVHPSSLNFRRSPGGEKVGALPERSVVERLGIDDVWWRVRTRSGFVGYVHSAFLTPVSA